MLVCLTFPLRVQQGHRDTTTARIYFVWEACCPFPFGAWALEAFPAKASFISVADGSAHQWQGFHL